MKLNRMKLISSVVLSLSWCTLMIFAGATHSDVLHLDWRDKAVSPWEDFYAYANGQWQQHHPIPPQYATWGTFTLAQENVQKQVYQMLLAASKNKTLKPGSIEQKVGDFYFSGMDEPSINQLGLAPLQPDFARIDAIKNASDLQDVLAYLQKIGVDACFDFTNMQDFKNSNVMIGAFMQDGLGLPDRDYYLKKEKKFQQIRRAYTHYMTTMFQLLGDSPSDAAANAAMVMGIETSMAQASMSQIAQRDPKAIYHPMTIAQLEQQSPHFSWSRYLINRGYPEIKIINLGMPDFFHQLDTLMTRVSLHDWKIYLRWHLLDSFAPYLSTPFVNAQFQMSSVLTGTKTLLPRWQRVVNTENNALGFAIGAMYVKKYLPPHAKEDVLQMIHALRETLRQDISSLSWMTPLTRQAALKKLALMTDRVGYPSHWRDYSTLVIDRGPYVLNVRRSNQFLIKRELDKIGKPIDKTEWAMTPQTINAYYDSSMNNINIPAGIMQSPFFDPAAPGAVNYGALGFIMGHEMTHGFDDSGAQFDGYGNLKKWWSPKDLVKFKAATDCIVKQFSQYKVDGDLSVQGPLVVGEATADLGGLTLAYRAFHASNAYKTAKTIDGVTPDQQFFLGVAHVWAANIRLEQVRNMVTIDPHPPARYRVNGTLANMPAFQKAFAIPDHSPMVNLHRCVIW